MTRALPHDDGDFWSDPSRDRGELARSILLQEPPGFVVGAPSRVDLGERHSLPLVGYYKCSTADKLAQRRTRSTALVAVRQEDNQVYAGPAFDPKGRAPQLRDRVPRGSATEYFKLDVRARARGLPWREGTLRVQLLSFDQPSPACEVRLERPGQDAAVRAFLEAQRRPGYPRPIYPKAADSDKGFEVLPSYAKSCDSPTLPAEAGIALVAPRQVVLDGYDTCLLRAGFRLAPLERERVKPRPQVASADLEATGWCDVGDDEARAVVPVTLVLLREGGRVPVLLPLQVPVYEDPGPGELPTGWLNVDLLSLGLGLMPAAYALYAFSGAVVAGPLPVVLLQA